MKRLTVKGPSGLITIKDKSENGVNYAIKCLSDYEDTGLTPEQIRELAERDTAKAPEVFDGYWYKCPICGMYAGRIKGKLLPQMWPAVGMGGIICHCPGVKDAKIKQKKDISIQHACNVNRNMSDKKHLTKNRITLETMEMLNTKRPRNILEIRRS